MQANLPGGSSREERYQLQEVARSVLQGMRSGMKFCLRSVRKDPAWNIPGVAVMLGVSLAFYLGFRVCGLIWVCPVCAARISEGRRKELRKASAEIRRRGGRILLLTLTFPHYAGQDLEELYKKMRKARRTMLNRSGKLNEPGWKRWSRSIGLLGSVCGVEVTHGENGWHIHTHEILFVKPGGGVTNIKVAEKEILFPAWRLACLAAGLPEPSEEYGVKLQNGDCDAVAAYIAKWGVEEELTKSHSKKGKSGNKTPWDLLRDVRDSGDCESAELFRIFARVFKGKRQLVWSDGLRRELLGEDRELSDQELAAEIEDPKACQLGILLLEDVKVVLAAGAREKLLRVAETERSWPPVLRFVEELCRGA